LATAVSAVASAAEPATPPAGSAGTLKEPFSATRKKAQVFAGRMAVLYEHDCPKSWGPEESGRQAFWVVLPKTPKSTPGPLLVYLHSAGVFGEAGCGEMQHCLHWTEAGGAEFTGLTPNSPVNAPHGWWGYNSVKSDRAKYQHQETPVERRVLATIEWVVQKYHIDRNRIYLCGISMGGCGTLGIGLCHGDVFAATLAGVPAGADYAACRMHFPPPPAASASPAEREKYLVAVSGAGLPDAPPLVDFSSQQDTWSSDQPQLLRAMHDGRHAVVFAWGPWGHINHYEATDRAAYEFPWLRIRKDEAYPVFTDASTDQHYPGCNPPHPDVNGQINAYFRWKAVEDTAGRFAIELRLVHKSELTAPSHIPAESVADVTLRRLQKFKVQPKQRYRWTFGAGPHAQSGVVEADAAGLLVFKRLAIRGEPAQLCVQP
jgi:hypothetical protein